MEVVGRLAGGVAHDFNNLLTVIAGYTQLALAELDPDHPLRSQLLEVNKAAARAGQLTLQLLTFSRNEAAAPELTSVDAVVSDTQKMLRRLIGEDIRIETRLAAAQSQVMADPAQLAQVLMNLVVNARDAMPGGGQIDISTSLADLEPDGAGALGLAPGPYVCLRVSDTGTGMDEETLGRIFEPFFTTKPAGQGTGLGLPIVYGVVKQCGGGVHVESRPGAGARFDIFLPVARTGAIAGPEASSEEGPRGSGTVLLVEDEDAVRRLAGHVLSRAGYKVLAASNGVEALDLFRAHAPEIRVLLTDLTMPELGGRELARRLLGAKPSLTVIYMSGYSSGDVTDAPGECDEFIRKPFLPAALLKALQRAGERNRRAGCGK
jgi:CheY-like chemotaxis protein/anti-sigma regulatory factor (Ser/Thr protein kinase)